MDFLKKRLPAQVGRYLQGIEFPARREELVGKLEQNGVPGPLVSQLRKRLPEREYRGPRMYWTPCAKAASRGCSVIWSKAYPRPPWVSGRLRQRLVLGPSPPDAFATCRGQTRALSDKPGDGAEHGRDSQQHDARSDKYLVYAHSHNSSPSRHQSGDKRATKR